MSPISLAIVSPSRSPIPGIVTSSRTRGSARASGRSSCSIGIRRSSSTRTIATTSPIERRQTAGTPRSARNSSASGVRSRSKASLMPNWLRTPWARLIAAVRSLIMCMRRPRRSLSSRSANVGTCTCGTRSRRASSASTRASSLSVLAASEPTALALRASAICTVQPAACSRSRTHAAPLIISMHADASGPRRITRAARPSSSAGTQPSSITTPAGVTAHHRARRVAQSIPTNSCMPAPPRDGNALEAAPDRGRHRFMTFLVAMAAMDQRVLAKDVLDRAAQRLAAVDDEQDRLLGIQAAIDEIGQQRARERRVLRRALPEPERNLDALGRDPERDDMRAVGDLQAVEHHHRQPHVIQPPRHRLPERGAGALDEQLRRRRLRRRRGRLLDLAADGLADRRELARRDAGEHAVHHRPRQRVAVGEVPVALDRQLVLVIRRPHARATDRDAPAAQRHRPVLVTVTLRDAIAVVLALRTDDLVDLELHQLVHDTEPDADAQREQALPRRPDQLAQRLLNLRRQRALRRLQGRDDLGRSYLLHGGSSCPRGLGLRPSRSQPERTRREDRHSKFYEISDNLAPAAEPVRPARREQVRPARLLIAEALLELHDRQREVRPGHAVKLRPPPDGTNRVRTRPVTARRWAWYGPIRQDLAQRMAQRPAPPRHREALRCALDDRARSRCACGSCLAVSPCPHTCATAAADAVSLRVLDASRPGACSQVPLDSRSRGRQAAGGEARVS